MVKVQYIGSRSCYVGRDLWKKYEIKDISKELFEKLKTQGFVMVKEKKEHIKRDENIFNKINKGDY